MANSQNPDQLWRSRAAILVSAVALGLVALGFAWLADEAQGLFRTLSTRWPYAPLALTPIGFVVIFLITRRFAPQARGSGIPQVIARVQMPEQRAARELTSIRTGIAKVVLTLGVLCLGASTGREGPTVQISAALMRGIHKLFKVRITTGIIIAGGAAGVSAAFNTPLAGVAFAIEELAASYEQKVALLVMVAVMTSGLVSLGIAGDYQYFGSIPESLPMEVGLLAAVLAGLCGGVTGGLFSLALQRSMDLPFRPYQWLRARPALWAGFCGIVVAALGVITHGLTFGAGYEPARHLVEGGSEPLWFAPAKFIATLATSLAGIPGGVFAPSLATGCGLGQFLSQFFPNAQHGALVVLMMIAYFTAVVRAPLTAILIISEMTNSRAIILPLFLAALIADWVSAQICHEKLYHGLSKAFIPPADPRATSATRSITPEATVPVPTG